AACALPSAATARANPAAANKSAARRMCLLHSGRTAQRAPSPRERGEGWGEGRLRSALQQHALLAFEDLLDRRTLEQPVLQRGVVLQLLDPQAVDHSPAVKHQRIAARRRVLRAENVILAGKQAVDFL